MATGFTTVSSQEELTAASPSTNGRIQSKNVDRPTGVVNGFRGPAKHIFVSRGDHRHAGGGTAHGLVDAFMSANASKAFLAAGDRYQPKGTRVASLV